MKARRVDAAAEKGKLPATASCAATFSSDEPTTPLELNSLFQDEKQAVPQRRRKRSTCRMVSFLCAALASVKCVTYMLFTPTAVGEGAQRSINLAASMPPEAQPAPTDAAAMPPPPGRGGWLAPPVEAATPGGTSITIVTGRQVPVDAVRAAASRAEERSNGSIPESKELRKVQDDASETGKATTVKGTKTTDGGGGGGGDGPIPTSTSSSSTTKGSAEHSTSTGISTTAAVAVRHSTDDPKEQLGKLECIPCDAMFRNVDEAHFGAKVHNVTVQIRGEPKSGTTFMYEWAVNALMVACDHIERMYGMGTCTVDFESVKNAQQSLIATVNSETRTKEMRQVFLVFDPTRRQGPASSSSTDVVGACPCENLDRAVVSVRSYYKHSFPVGEGCAWQHVNNITPAEAGCRTVDGRKHGRKVEDHKDTAKCFDMNPCKVIVDDRAQQMLILRDPRAVTVSTYFHLKLFPNAPARPIVGESIEDFVERMMPTICRYIHIRYLLLVGEVRDRTTPLWYDESWADPVGWHRSFMSLTGLSPPDSVIEKAADTATRRDFGFKSAGANVHLGGIKATKTRMWEDEVSASLKDRMDELCRLWLPPAVLETLGILPQYW